MTTIGQPASGGDDTGSRDERDDGAVRALHQQLVDAWNAGSGEPFAAPFAPDGDLVGFGGVHFRGPEQIVTFHQQLFDKWMRDSRLVGQVEELRFLTPEVALMYAVGNTVGRGKTQPARERASIQTLVAVRGGGEWRLAAFQNTRIRPIGSNTLTFMLWATFDRLWPFLRLSTNSAAKEK